MANTFANFRDSSRRLQPKIEVNLSGSYVDYTEYLDNFTILHTPRTPVYGIVDITLDAELFIPNASAVWMQGGLPVKGSIAVQNDTGSAPYQVTLFTGSTVRSKTVPSNSVAIRVTSYNSNYLQRKVGQNFEYISTDVHTIMKDVLASIGVPSSAYSSLGASGINIAYAINNNQIAEDIIQELAAVTLRYYGFDKDGNWVTSSLTDEFSSATETYPLSSIFKYETRNTKGNYFNKVTVRGKEVRSLTNYVPYGTALVTSFNSTGGLLVKAGQTKFLTIPIIDARLISASVFDFILGQYSTVFRLSDDDTSTVYTTYTILDQILAQDGDEQSLVLKVFNSGSSDAYLRFAKISGTGIKYLGSVEVVYQNDSAIAQDGEVVELVMDSPAIQSVAQANIILAKIQRHFSDPTAERAVEVQGRPNSQVALPVAVSDRSGSLVNSYITQVDLEVSQDKGYIHLLKYKKAPDPISYLICDDPSGSPTLCDVNYCYY